MGTYIAVAIVLLYLFSGALCIYEMHKAPTLSNEEELKLYEYSQ